MSYIGSIYAANGGVAASASGKTGTSGLTASVDARIKAMQGDRSSASVHAAPSKKSGLSAAVDARIAAMR